MAVWHATSTMKSTVKFIILQLMGSLVARSVELPLIRVGEISCIMEHDTALGIP